MIGTVAEHVIQTSRLEVALGCSDHSDPSRAAVEAAHIAQEGLLDSKTELAIVVTAGQDDYDPTPLVRRVIGPVGIAGGAAKALMTDSGIKRTGALVILLAARGDATSGVASVPGDDVAEAGRTAARIIMAGWPFRLRYPRGLGIAFTRLGAPTIFLEGWRQFVGPKMRTVCGLMPGRLFGLADRRPVVSVACLEASYSTGLGHAEGFDPGDRPDVTVLLQGTAEATATALKRLEERSARLVLVVESAARQEALGQSAEHEWARVQAEIADRAPSIGWVCEEISGYGRGIQPFDEHGSLLVAAVGDAPTIAG